MPRITTCFEHEKEWDGVDATPDTQWDSVERLVASATVNGVVQRIDCTFCRWASDPATPAPHYNDPYTSLSEYDAKDETPIMEDAFITGAEAALGTVGDPTLQGEEIRYVNFPVKGSPAVTTVNVGPGYHVGGIASASAFRGKPKKEKNMPKTPATPAKRERKRGMILTRTIGNMQVTLRVEGNVLDIPKEQRETFWQLVDLMKGLEEPPKGA